MLCAVIADPYSYPEALEPALAEAQWRGEPLWVVFFISPTALARLVGDLGEKGWLGPASLRALEASMRSGFRLLAEDVLADIAERAKAVGVRVETAVFEGDVEDLFSWLNRRGCSKVLGVRALERPGTWSPRQEVQRGGDGD